MPHVVIARDALGMTGRRAAWHDRYCEDHFAAKPAGVIRDAGALLDKNGLMNGSVILYDVNSSAELETALASEIFKTEGVRGEIEIRPFDCVQWSEQGNET